MSSYDYVKVDEACRKEILTIAELQANDVHLDRSRFIHIFFNH
jgi:hypothetical protein